jgi:Tfp pilus assembly protein PilN
LPWTVSIIIAAVSILALIVIVQKAVESDAQAQAVQKDVSTLQSESNALKKQIDELKGALTAGQVRTLKSAHALIDRKRFSWSLLFAHLEESLPGSVRVSRIAVKEVKTEGDSTVADLDLTVASKSPETITEMISEMDRLGVFRAELISQNPQHGRGETGSEYELNVHYTPPAGVPVTPSERRDRPVDTATGGSSKTKP